MILNHGKMSFLNLWTEDTWQTRHNVTECIFIISEWILFLMRTKFIESFSWGCVLIFQLKQSKLCMKTNDFDNLLRRFWRTLGIIAEILWLIEEWWLYGVTNSYFDTIDYYMSCFDLKMNMKIRDTLQAVLDISLCHKGKDSFLCLLY